MKVCIMGMIEAEGTKEELAVYSYLLICFLNDYANRENKKKAKAEAEAIIKAMNASFKDLIDQEGDDKE